MILETIGMFFISIVVTYVYHALNVLNVLNVSRENNKYEEMAQEVRLHMKKARIMNDKMSLLITDIGSEMYEKYREVVSVLKKTNMEMGDLLFRVSCVEKLN
jgi:NTP pyrophosphatase (non-canonical NTP hydrolase)